MLKKFRRGSSNSEASNSNTGISSLTLRRASLATTASTATNDSTVSRSSERKTTTTTNFFSLPAEIRNSIYKEVANQTTLYLPAPSKKSSKVSPPLIPALLVTSTQTRNEYLPLLLAIAPLSVRVENFNFWNVMRVTASLYSSERKALRTNGRLKLTLVLDRCTPENTALLRRWLGHRCSAGAAASLPWSYEIGWPGVKERKGRRGRELSIEGLTPPPVPTEPSAPTPQMVKWADLAMRRRVVLLQYMERLRRLHASLEEGFQWEVAPIIEAVQQELRYLGRSLPPGRRPPSPSSLYGRWTTEVRDRPDSSR